MLTYFTLTKPKIIILLTITGIGGFFVPAPSLNGVSILDLLVFVYIGYASAGGAMTINNVIDRDIDILMERTKSRATVGENALNPINVLLFGSSMAASGVIIAYFYFNALTAVFLLWGVLFYLFGYSLFLKRKSILNTILGGLASPAPVWVGYAARLNEIPIEGWLLGGLVFIWTPSHTWALSTKYLDDYKAANIPMLPVKLGMEKTGAITFYAGLFVIAYGTWLSWWLTNNIWITFSLIIPHLIFLYGLWVFKSKPSVKTANVCFKAHNFWLALVFGLVVIYLWI